MECLADQPGSIKRIKDMKRSYKKGKLTVYWDSDKCVHAGVCVGELPEVFDTSRRPWINLDGADEERIKSVIDRCPAGALSYQIQGEKEAGITTIKVVRDGPYKITGGCLLVKEGGEVIEAGRVFSLCRCGASRKMPFCDGSHRSAGFKDT